MKYRKDVDGLRAVAVVPVILCHAGYATFAGGFVGVDVFFVISGFLITGILLDELADSGRFSIGRFYERRARRILPALFLMILVSVPFALWLMLPQQLVLFSQGIVSILIFCSNFFFWKKVDYFAAPAAENPLIHTWSLAVEEQFYLIFPLLLWGLVRLGLRHRGIVAVLVALSIASFAIAEWGWPRYPSPNFYLLPSRAWELGVGGLAAVLIRREGHRPVPLLALAGLAMILAAVFLYTEDTPFPSRYALLPVLGSGFVVLFGQSPDAAGKGPLATRLLCLPPVVMIGLVSYSAYLWHQPVLAFMRLASVTTPSPVLMGGLSVVSLGLGWLSWRYVEAPFRRREGRWFPGRGQIFAASLAGGVALAALAAVGIGSKGFEARWLARNAAYPDLIAALNYGRSDDNFVQFIRSGCFGGATTIDRCLKLSDTKKNYLLVGDSFAAHYATALQERYPDDNVMQFTIPGCRPVWNGIGVESCLDAYRALDTFLARNTGRIDGVLIAARWRNVEAPDLERAIGHLRAIGARVAVIGPSPEYSVAFPALLLKLAQRGIQESGNIIWNHDRAAVETHFRAVAQRAGAGFVPILSDVCPGGVCRNYADDGRVMHFDYGHFTLSGARTVLATYFPPQLSDLFPAP